MNTGLFLIEISSWVISIKEEKVMVEKSFQTNPKYKDRLFCMIFGNENEKQNGISLYNALNGINYSEDEDVEVTTIRDVIYINLKNDVSFIVDSYMSLFEQQSSVILQYSIA